MKRFSEEAAEVAGRITEFIREYAPRHRAGSEHTVRSYETALSLFLGYLEQACGILPNTLAWSCFSKDRVEGWLAWMRDVRGNAPSTCNVRLSSLRAFLEYAAGKDVSLLSYYQQSTAVRKLRHPKAKVKGLTKDAVWALMRAPDTSTRTGRRDLALMVLLYATAARIGEALSIRASHLKLDAPKPHVIVTGKGGKTRTLYLLPRAVEHMRAYLREFHGPSPDPDDLLFYSRRTDRRRKLTQAAVRARLRIHAATAHEACGDVPLDLHAHQFRHARASHWLQEGVNIVQISFLLGHANLQTTMIYLDITTEDELRALELLETEEDKAVEPKWLNSDGSLIGFCGL